jgi:hypothetical protein
LVHTALKAPSRLLVEGDDLGHVKWSSHVRGWIAPDRDGARDGRPAPEAAPCATPPADLTEPVLAVTLTRRVLTPMISTRPL